MSSHNTSKMVPGSFAMQLGAMEAALDSAVTVLAKARDFVREHKHQLIPGDRQKLAVTLESMGRVCFSVAQEVERPTMKVEGGKS